MFFIILSKAHCMSLVDEELHWVVVVCLERGEEYLVERMQALKLIKKFMSIAGQLLVLIPIFILILIFIPVFILNLSSCCVLFCFVFFRSVLLSFLFLF